MRYLSLNEVLELYSRIMDQTDGDAGILGLEKLESAIAQPRMTFDGEELYSTIFEKASALAFSLIQNHPFIDGNKRIGHAAMDVFLIMNGFEIKASVDEQEAVILKVASGVLKRNEFTKWIEKHIEKRK